MKINGLDNNNIQAVAVPVGQGSDAVTKNLQNQIANAQKKLQDLSADKELDAETKMKKRQEIQQEIASLRQQLQTHQMELRKEQQRAAAEKPHGETKSAEKRAQTEGLHGMSQAAMSAMISADCSMKQAKAQGSVSSQMEGRAGVLESEVRADRGRGADTEKKEKEKELADLQTKAQTAEQTQFSILSDARKEWQAAAETDRDDRKRPEDIQGIRPEDKKDTETEDGRKKNVQTISYTRVDIRL